MGLMGSTKCWKVESRWLRQIISKLIKFKLHDSLTDIVEWRTPKPWYGDAGKKPTKSKTSGEAQ